MRVAVTGIFSGERPASAIAALRAAVAHYQSLGITVTRVINSKPPISRLTLPMDNLLKFHS